MAKTIKEMLQESAYKAYPEELDNETEHNVSMRVGYKIGYEAGANAVIEEIENILYRRYSDDGDPHQRWIDMDKVFKELKG